MLRFDDIKNALAGVVGFEQAYNPAEYIDADLTTSESGLTFQGAHPLMTLANVRSTMPEDFGYIYPDWNATTQYAIGAKVKTTVNGTHTIWIALVANINSQPTAQNANWAVYNMLSDYLRRKRNDAINEVVQKFATDKELRKETKTLMERRTFFDGAARLQALIDGRNKIVGMEIVPVRAMGVTAKIERIGLQMVGATGTVKVYLFHSSQSQPMRTIELNYTNTNGGFQWFTPNEPVYLPYISSGNDSGGAWFLCYNQAELPQYMQALNVSKDWSKEPCQTCLHGSIESWHELTKYMQVSPFQTNVPSGFTQNPRMFDIAQLAYTNTMNYGINCEVSVACDLSDFIIEQRNIFASVIQKQVAANLLRAMAMNPDVRVNRNQTNVNRMDVLYEIDGNTNNPRPNGLGAELAKAYKALSISTQGIDRICLSCNNSGVRYRGV